MKTATLFMKSGGCLMIPWKLPLFMKSGGFHEKWQFSLGNLINQLIQDKSFSFIVCLGEAMSDDSMRTAAFHENCRFSVKTARKTTNCQEWQPYVLKIVSQWQCHHSVEPLVLSVLDLGWLWTWVLKPGWMHHCHHSMSVVYNGSSDSTLVRLGPKPRTFHMLSRRTIHSAMPGDCHM